MSDFGLDEVLMAQGLTAEQRRAMIEMLMASGTGGYGASGMPGGWGMPDDNLSYQNDMVDYSRDLNTLMADQMSGAMAGMGGYGGFGEVGLQQFDPIVEREYVEGPENNRYIQYLSQSPDTLEGWAANLVKTDGAMSLLSEANTILQGMAKDPGLLTPEQQVIGAQLQQFQYVDPVTQAPRMDMDSLRDWALKLEEEKYMAAPPGAAYDEQTGQWYTETSTPSPAAEWYAERGLPLPTLEYSVGDFSPEAGELGMQSDAWQQLIAEREGTGQYDALAAQTERFRPGAEQAQEMLRRGYGHAEGPRSGFGQQNPWSRWPGSQASTPTQQPDGPSEPGTLDSWGLGGMGNVDYGGILRGLGRGALNATSAATGLEGQSDGDFLGQGAGNNGIFSQAWERISGAIPEIDASPGYRNLDDAERARLGQKMQQFRDAQMQQTWGRGADELESQIARQKALGRRFIEPQQDGKLWSRGANGLPVYNFAPDRGVAQAHMDLAGAQASGRTPLSDALRSRAMATFLMGG